jgi:hypothetical protein
LSSGRAFDLHPDGTRVVGLLPADSTRVTVLLNFFDELKRKVK